MEGVPSNPKSALYGFPHFVCVLHNAAHMQSWKKEEKWKYFPSYACLEES